VLVAKVVSSHELVPGDLLVISADMIMPCDAVLIRGSCVVSEAMLTGESMPILKSELPNISDDNLIYDPMRDKTYTLFCGTKVLQSRAYGGTPVRCKYYRNM